MVMAADSSLLADRPLVGDVVDAGAPSSGASAFYGPLAAAMERIVGLAATALRAPFAFILLTGEDRRCFSAGPQRPDWTHHDTGALWRSGIVERIAGGTVQMRDVMAELSPEQRKAAATLEIGSLLGVPLTSTSGEVIGIFCAADPAPTLWNDDDAEMLRGFASAAVSDWELRRAVAEHEANERRLQFDASHDTLTGLANRAVLLARLRAALDRPSKLAGTNGTSPDSVVDVPPEELVAVFFLDVNDFRSINERFGHHVGDQLLATLGRRLQQSAGPEAVVARLGGDEFAVLLEKVDAPDVAEELAERFRVVLAQPTTIGAESVSLTVSVGIALSATAAELAEHVLRGADLAMARAKRDARGDTTGSRPVVFDWTLAAEARSRRRL